MDFDDSQSLSDVDIKSEPGEDSYEYPPPLSKQKKATANELIASHFDSLIEHVEEFTPECIENLKPTPEELEKEIQDIEGEEYDFYLEDDCSPVFEHTKEFTCDFPEPIDIFDKKFNEKFVPDTSEFGKLNEFNIDAKFRQIAFSEDPENIKVLDYVTNSRDSMLSELKRARDATLAHYEKIKSECDELPENELRRKLFANQSYMLFQPDTIECDFSSVQNRSVFPIYLFVFDFYLDKQIQFDLA